MAQLNDLIDRVRAAEEGPQVVAAFDYDGTLITGYSAREFYDHRIRNRELGPIEFARTLWAATGGIEDEGDFASFLELSLGAWRGRAEEEMNELGRKLFRNAIAGRMHWEAYQLVEAHRAMGHTLVLASSATRFQVQPMADELGIKHALYTPIEVVDGLLTGNTGGPPLWGAGKAAALEALAEEHDLDLGSAFAYSNGREDVPFLELVDNPVAVAPDSGLREEAERRGWPILECKPHGGRPGPLDLVRTGAFYAGFASAFATGIGVGLARRSRQATVDLAAGVGSELALALAGIDVNVTTGSEYLWSARPCVFVFNHQSKIDPVIVMKLLRTEFTGVAKAEAKNVPLFGAMFQLAGVAFVDRGNTAQAKKVLEPAVRKVREEGFSLAIAPEGTRTPTPRLAPFKKGAFHIAMQAGVPVVPIVLRNSGEVMWRGAQIVHPGRVDVAVLPPIDTSEWTAETVSEHRDQVQGLFEATLADWPDEAAIRLLSRASQ
jgi:putative phosphoserine phosphatase/1-acylglycerol-3-phosphate O-acyltransferase